MSGGPALRLAAGRARAAELMPYLASALFAVTPVQTPGIGTFGVDARWRLYWDPDFCAGLTVSECAGVWLHEVGHLLREHAARWAALLEPEPARRQWNAAGDAAINADLREASVVLPATGAWYPELVPGGRRGMTTEALYRLLRASSPDGGPQDQPDLRDCGSGAGGSRRAWEVAEGSAPPAGDGSVDEGRAVLLRQQVARQVAEHARTRAGVPLGWQRWAEGVLDPQVDWRAELRSVVRRSAATVAGLRDPTYSRPSRRAASVPGVVLPAMRQPRPPRVAVVVDTSGSMDPGDLAQCLAEIGDLVARVSRGGSEVAVLACDTSVAAVQVVRDVRRLALTGGGGTDLRVGIAAAAARRPRADLVITLTDGLTPWPPEPPASNPGARYVAVLVGGAADRGAADQVPGWMHRIVVAPR